MVKNIKEDKEGFTNNKPPNIPIKLATISAIEFRALQLTCPVT